MIENEIAKHIVGIERSRKDVKPQRRKGAGKKGFRRAFIDDVA